MYANDENKLRGNWTNRFDYILSAVGCAVGLGNLWRFPYRAYQNGGASFLIPYSLTLALIGLPGYFLQSSLGQFASVGPISTWKAIPLLKGVGWGMMFANHMMGIYYNMIIAYVLRYLFASFTSSLPWSHCRPEWAQLNCYERHVRLNASASNDTEHLLKYNEMYGSNETNGVDVTSKRKTPSEIYWEHEVLGLSAGIDDQTSVMKWDLVLCLLLAWIIVFLCLFRGIKSSGKVVYFTALFPYVVLVILLIWNVQLEGAWLGIKFYIVPDWQKLANPKVWYTAGTQIFFSLGVGFGSLETMASYNKFHNNIYRDSISVAVINCATSVFGGFAIFSVIGFMAAKTDLPVGKVAAGGPGLAFVAYPEGIALMPGAPFWAILFFSMLFTLGIDSQFAGIETIVTAIVDEYPWFLTGHRKMGLLAIVCVVDFILGLPLCSKAGIYVMTLFDNYSAGFNLFIFTLVQVLAVSWIYGVNRFCDDICMMIGHRPNWYWKACWSVLGPLVISFLMILAIIDDTPSSYGAYVFPSWADGIGWLMFAASVAIVPLFAVYVWIAEYRRAKLTDPKATVSPVETLRHLLRPTPDWGPALTQFRTGRYASAAPSVGTDVWTSGSTMPPTKVESEPHCLATSNSVHPGAM